MVLWCYMVLVLWLMLSFRATSSSNFEDFHCGILPCFRRQPVLSCIFTPCTIFLPVTFRFMPCRQVRDFIIMLKSVSQAYTGPQLLDRRIEKFAYLSHWTFGILDDHITALAIIYIARCSHIERGIIDHPRQSHYFTKAPILWTYLRKLAAITTSQSRFPPPSE